METFTSPDRLEQLNQLMGSLKEDYQKMSEKNNKNARTRFRKTCQAMKKQIQVMLVETIPATQLKGE